MYNICVGIYICIYVLPVGVCILDTVSTGLQNDFI